MEWMGHILVLFDVHFIVLDQDHRTLVVVLAAIIWRAKNSYDRGEGRVATPSVHLVSIDLDLMSTNDGYEIILS